MKLSMKKSILLLFMTFSYVLVGSHVMAEPPMATMLHKGETIFEKHFDDQAEVDELWNRKTGRGRGFAWYRFKVVAPGARKLGRTLAKLTVDAGR